MPATQNCRLSDWHEPPALTGAHELSVPEMEVFVESRQECAQFVLLQGLQEIAAYEGYPDLQQEIAQEIADKIFDPNKNIVAALHKYISGEHSRGDFNEAQEEAADEPVADVIELKTVFVATRYDVETGEVLPSLGRSRSFG